MLVAAVADVCARTFGTAPARQFVLEWLDAEMHSDAATHLTFETVLNETGATIDFIYRTPTGVDVSHASIGLQHLTGLVTSVHRDPVAPMTGIRWTPVP